MNVAAVILAAGASKRMGRPKALLRLEGETFVERLVQAMSLHCRPVVVVLGFHGEEIRAVLKPETVVWNPAPEKGMLSSLQCGLAVTASRAQGVLFTPVDYPAVLPSTVGRLADALRGGAPLAIPSYGGCHGHPVGIAAPLVDEILALPEGAAARDVVRKHRPKAVILEVDDRGILDDIDDPEAYRRLLEEVRRA